MSNEIVVKLWKQKARSFSQSFILIKILFNENVQEEQRKILHPM